MWKARQRAPRAPPAGPVGAGDIPRNRRGRGSRAVPLRGRGDRRASDSSLSDQSSADRAPSAPRSPGSGGSGHAPKASGGIGRRSPVSDDTRRGVMGPSPRGRYAPSPTGMIHAGNARTALAAWLSARSRGGSFVWRLEDLDPPRVVPGVAEAQLADLAWLGLDWDEGPDVGGPHAPYEQSRRSAL